MACCNVYDLTEMRESSGAKHSICISDSKFPE